MGLLSYFKRSVSRSGAAPRSGLSDEAILAARAKARQRLIGAAVLVVLGVVTLPLLFDNEPRPLPPTAAIEMASQPLRDDPPAVAGRTNANREIEEVAADAGQEVAAMPSTRVPLPIAASRASGVSGVSSAPLAPASAMVMPEGADTTQGGTRERRAQEEAMRRDKARVERERAAEKAAEKARHDKEAREQAQRAAKDKDKAAKAASEARARDLMAAQKPSGTTTTTSSSASTKERFVVQIGAFADHNAATQARARVDKLGVKTYTQVTDTAAGTRIRVRVGPFQDRAEAEKTLSKLKASGMSGVVLTL